MSRLLRKTGFCVLTFALAEACNDSPRDRDAAFSQSDSAAGTNGDASVSIDGCAQNPIVCDAGAPPGLPRDGVEHAGDAGRVDDAGRAQDAGPIKSPFDSSVGDSGVRDAEEPRGCAAGARKCNLANGAYGICTPSNDCGGCEHTSDCVEVYGNGFLCDTTTNVCFPQI